MKKFLALLSFAFAATLACASAQVTSTGDVRTLVNNSDGSYNEKMVTFGANKIIAFGANPGTFSLLDPSTYATVTQLNAVSAAQPDYRTNSFAVAALATSKTITYTNAFTTGTAWNVVVSTGNLVTNYTITNSTATGFTVVFPSALLGSGTMTFIAVPVVAGKQ